MSSKSLMGEFQHTIDVKGRMNFPTKLRELLGISFIVTKGLDGCLFVYSQEEWSNLEARIKTKPLAEARQLNRYFFANACEVETDKQGRILLPQNLREHAGLEKEVVVIGASTHAEIWDKSRWQGICDNMNEESILAALEGV